MTFGERYLREPTPEDVQRLLQENADRGFPGMLGSVDCMQWPWKNYPVDWQGSYWGKDKESSFALEAVASYDLWFWHAFFGMPGSNNDLNVLAHSPLFDNMLKGVAPSCNYVINGHQYNMGYFLADGIYPKLTAIVQDFSQTLDIPDYVRFNKYQMDKRKDVERAFGVLQELHLQLRDDLVKHIVARPGRGGHAGDISSLEGSDMENVDLPSSEGDYEDTNLDEEVVPGQNEDGAFVYYGDYNDQIPDDIEHAVEYEHDGDGDEDDYDDYEEDKEDDSDDEEYDSYDDVTYNDAGIMMMMMLRHKMYFIVVF
ncbi:uncharacterized protein LOC113306117 [Papaver somniferum]|uniref:uncharacterized protein LOC113306117 n=1 Tax=Papaver somniferum TaxID=3469 RepID=UPI000E6FB66A|nr:uncharacterized protein LOC113306117 [Papaver somniferum]